MSSVNLSKSWYEEEQRKGRYKGVSYSDWKEIKKAKYKEAEKQRKEARRQANLATAEKMAESGFVYVREMGQKFKASSYRRIPIDKFKTLPHPEKYAIYSKERWYQRVSTAKKEGIKPKEKPPTPVYKEPEQEKRYSPQVERTIEQFKSGVLKSKSQPYLVGGEVVLGERGATILAEVRKQEAEEKFKREKEKIVRRLVEKNMEELKERKEAERIFKERDVEQVSQLYPPERIKSSQETMDVMSRVDWKQFVTFTEKTPEQEAFQIEKTFKGEDIITPEQIATTKDKGVLYRWGQDIDVKEQNLLVGIETKQKRTTQAVSELFDLTESTESISPYEYKAKTESKIAVIENYGLTAKESALAITAPAFFGVARGGQTVIYSVRHPIETVSAIVQMPFMIPEIVKEVGKKAMVNPFGTVAEIGTEVYLYGKITKGIKRVLKPKVTETPIKGKGVKILETVRKTKSGKIVKDTKIDITSVRGKPKTRFFWQKPKVKVRKVIDVKAMRRASTIQRKGLSKIEAKGEVKGKLYLKEGGKKVKFKVKKYKEAGQPQTYLEPATKYTGKTKAGTPLKGKTPKIKPEGGLDIVKKTRKGYIIKQLDKVEGIYKDGSFFVKIEKGKIIRVPPKASIKVSGKESRAFSSKKITKGELQAEIQQTGVFVKRKYTPKPPKKPSLKVLGKDLKVDMGDYKLTESGKWVKVGKKPLSPAEKLLIEKTTTTKGTKKTTTTKGTKKTTTTKGTKKTTTTKGTIIKGTKLKTITLTPKPTTTKPISVKSTTPIIEVITKGTTIKGVPLVIYPVKEKQKEVIDIYTEFYKKGKQSPIIKTTPKEKIGESRFSIIKEAYTTDSKQAIEQKQKPIIEQKQIPITEQKVTVGVKETLQQEERIITTQQEERIITTEEIITDVGVRETGKIETPGVIIPIVPTAEPKEDIDISTGRKEQGYNVYMYEKGKRVKANVQALPRREAERLGMDIADNSLSASFKVSKVRERVPSARRSKLATGLPVSPAKFRESKSQKRRGFWVEKSKHRLDSVGERKGIKSAQLIAERKKGIGMFNFSKKNKG